MINRLLLLLSLCSTFAFSTVINFDTLPVNTIVTTQYSDVTFSTDADSGVYVVPGAGTAFNTSSPNGICPSMDAQYCLSPLTISFGGLVTNVSMLVTVVNDLYSTFDVSVNNQPSFTVSFSDLGGHATHVLSAVPSLAGIPYNSYKLKLNESFVSNITLSNYTDPAGLVFDDVTFRRDNNGVSDDGSGANTPEPMALGLCGLGLAITGSLKRYGPFSRR